MNTTTAPAPFSRTESMKDKAQDYLMQCAKSKEYHLIILGVLRVWLQSESEESFLELYPESHPLHSIALATAIVGA